MTISQLWTAHYANPNDMLLRAQIAQRDARGATQLWPISGRCIVNDHDEEVSNIESELDEWRERAEDAESDNRDADDLESENSDLLDKIELLKDELEDLKARLAKTEAK